MFFQRLQAFSLLVAFNVNPQATLSFYSNRRQPFNRAELMLRFRTSNLVVAQFDVEAALRRHLAS
jgi:hypothetical protein